MMTIEHPATRTGRLVTAWLLAFGVVGCALFLSTDSVVTATNPDTRTYDESLNPSQEGCGGRVAPQPVPWQVGDAESAGCARALAVHAVPHGG
jgi:hypothetical protein